MQTILTVYVRKNIDLTTIRLPPKNTERNKWLIFHITYIVNNKKCFEIQIFPF